MSGIFKVDGETYCDDCWRGMTTVICCPTHAAATEMVDLLRRLVTFANKDVLPLAVWGLIPETRLLLSGID